MNAYTQKEAVEQLADRYRIRELDRTARRTAREVDGLREKLDTPTSQGDDDE